MGNWHKMFVFFGISVFAAIMMIGLVANQVVAVPPSSKVIICHVDPNGVDPDVTLTVGKGKTANSHLLVHVGDHLGACNVCRDGFVDDHEACDDGNTSNTDACTNACAVAACGDGFVQAGEQCDDGGTANGDGCSSTCQNEAVCGDGSIDGAEECDDGNTNSGDGCNSICEDEYCGDGVLQVGEQCDGTDLDGQSCFTRGYDLGELACTGLCTFDTSDCSYE